MGWASFAFLTPYLISVLISASVGIYAWRRRDVTGALPFAVMVLAMAVRTLGYVFELISPSLGSKIFWDNLHILGGVVAPVASLTFVLQYTERKLSRPKLTLGLISIVPIICMLLVFTDSLHGWVRAGTRLVPSEPFPALVYGFTVPIWAIAFYSYGLILSGIFMLITTFIYSQRLYRAQVATIIIGILFPLVGTLLTLMGVDLSAHRDTTHFTFAIGNLIVAWGLFRYRLFDIVPVARDIVIEGMSDAVVVLDAQDRVVDLNLAAQEVVGHAAAEVIGQPAGQVFASWPDLLERFQDVEEAHTEIALEEGQDRSYYDIRLLPLRDQHDRFSGRLIVVRDVTRRKQAEEALQQAYDEMEEHVEARTAELTWAIEQLQREVAERNRAEEQVRRQAETLASLHETALDLVSKQGLADLLQAVVDRAVNLLVAERGRIWTYRPATDDLELVTQSGSSMDHRSVVLQRGDGLAGRVLESGQPVVLEECSFWEDEQEFGDSSCSACVAVPIFWGDHMLGILSLKDRQPRTFSPDDVALLQQFTPLAAAAIENARLLNDLQQQMARLRKTQAQLIQSAKLAAVGELAAGVAHELNNPLTSVLGYADLLETTLDPDSPIREDLKTIVQEALRARDIVRNLLSFARQTKPQRELTDINQILRQTLNVIRYYVEKSGVVIEEDYSPDLGSLFLDAGQMKQVFLNLVTNAVDSMPAGGKLSVRSAQVGDEVAISVSDTGGGIPVEIRERIFDPFFTSKPTGTGLGLSISLGLVQEHGGRITVESEEGQGSTFMVWLPHVTSSREVQDHERGASSRG